MASPIIFPYELYEDSWFDIVTYNPQVGDICRHGNGGMIKAKILDIQKEKDGQYVYKIKHLNGHNRGRIMHVRDTLLSPWPKDER